MNRRPLLLASLSTVLALTAALPGPSSDARIPTEQNDAGTGRDAGETPMTAIPVERGVAVDATLVPAMQAEAYLSVAGDEDWIEGLIQFARSYIYTTAIPPALVAATQVSLKLLTTEAWRRPHLQKLIARFRAGAEQLSLPLMASAFLFSS